MHPKDNNVRGGDEEQDQHIVGPSCLGQLLNIIFEFCVIRLDDDVS